jgi:WD40 repeat protein
VVNIYSLDGSPVHRLAGHKAGDGLNRSIARLVWDATGGRILTVGRDLTARLWSTQSARVLAFRGDGLEFEEFNHQGDRLAAWSARERVVRLMDLKGRIVRELPGHKSFIRTVRFSRDDRTVVTHSNDSIRIWRDDQSEPLTIRAEASALFTGRVEFNSNETHLVMIDPSARDTPKLAWRLNGGMPVPLADAGEVPARPATTSKWRLDWAVTELGQGFWLSNAATGIRFFLKSQLVFAGTVDASSEVDQHGYAHVDGLGETGFHVFLVDADSINRALRSEDLYGRLWAIDDETYRRYDIW